MKSVNFLSVKIIIWHNSNKTFSSGISLMVNLLFERYGDFQNVGGLTLTPFEVY